MDVADIRLADSSATPRWVKDFFEPPFYGFDWATAIGAGILMAAGGGIIGGFMFLWKAATN